MFGRRSNSKITHRVDRHDQRNTRYITRVCERDRLQNRIHARALADFSNLISRRVLNYVLQLEIHWALRFVLQGRGSTIFS